MTTAQALARVSFEGCHDDDQVQRVLLAAAAAGEAAVAQLVQGLPASRRAARVTTVVAFALAVALQRGATLVAVLPAVVAGRLHPGRGRVVVVAPTGPRGWQLHLAVGTAAVEGDPVPDGWPAEVGADGPATWLAERLVNGEPGGWLAWRRSRRQTSGSRVFEASVEASNREALAGRPCEEITFQYMDL